MKIIERKISDLIPYINNPRKNDEAVDKVASSIKKFGFKVPIIVDKKNEIIAGHTRYKASLKLGIDKVPCVIADDLSPAQVKAFRIADNKVAEQSDWDWDILKNELIDLEDMFTGFDVEEIEELYNTEEEAKKDDEPEVNFTEELLEEHNYIVLYFDNSVDWLQAKTLLDLKTVQALDSKKGFEKKGVGRVLKGSEVLKKLTGEK